MFTDKYARDAIQSLELRSKWIAEFLKEVVDENNDRFKELYDYLGVERKSNTPSELVKKAK